MDKYLAEVQRMVDFYKPLVEERVGIKLEDIVVSSFYQLWKDDFSKLKAAFNERERPIFQYSLFYGLIVPISWLHYKHKSKTSEMIAREGFIYAKSGFFRNHFYDMSETHIHIVHELAHKVQDAINSDINKTVSDASPDVSLPFREYWNQSKVYNEEIFRISTLKEGFAEYFSLDFCSDLYEIPLQNLILKRKAGLLGHAANNFPKKKIRAYHYDFRIYSLGYYFFSSIAAKTGPEIVFEVIRNPDVAFDELVHPDSYLKRKGVIDSESVLSTAKIDH